MTQHAAEQFAYMPASVGSRRGYQVVAKSPGISGGILEQMEPYMLPAGLGRGFSSSKSLLSLRGGLVAYSSITNVGDGYDGRPDALYNHTLVLSEDIFASIGFDTRALDAYFAKNPPRGALPSIPVEGSAPAPRISKRYQHLVLPVLRALFAGKKTALSGVDDQSFLPNVLAMLPPSMRLVPFSTCLPDPKKQPAYRLATYEGRMGPLPRGFADMSKTGSGPAARRLDDALLFLAERAESGSAGEVFSEFDRIVSSSPRDKLVLLSKIFGVHGSPDKLRVRRARDAMEMLRAFDKGTQSRLAPRIEQFLDKERTRGPALQDVALGKKITAKSLEKMLDGVDGANKRRVLEAVYGARGPDMIKNAGKLLSDIRDSKHVPDVYGFFVATKSLHPGILEFLSGKGRAPRKHRRRALGLLLPEALQECPEIIPEMLACNARDKTSKDDVRDLLKMLSAAAGSDLAATALASAPGKTEDLPSEAPGQARSPGMPRREPVRRFRDPVHGFIDVYENEMAVIEDSVFQRLRRIKQLSFAHLVYHGAEHSRFGHVLGTMHLAGRILESIKAKSGADVEEKDVRTARMAALLHDVGHRPYSHALDSLFDQSHEELSEALVTGRFAPIIEKGPDKVDPRQVASIIRGNPGKKPFLAELIAGQLDVDKMDYLLRDSHYAGVRYGAFDLDMLVDSMTLSKKNLAVSSKGIMAAEQMIIARYHMFEQVYHHKTKRALEGMMGKVADRLLETHTLEYPSPKSLREESDELATMDDAWLMKVVCSAKDSAMAAIAGDIQARKPFTEVANSDCLSLASGSRENRLGYFEGITESTLKNLKLMGLESSDVIMDKSSVLPHRIMPYIGAYDDHSILIYDDKSGNDAPIEQRSEIVKSISRDFVVHRIFARRPKAAALLDYLRKTHPGLLGSRQRPGPPGRRAL